MRDSLHVGSERPWGRTIADGGYVPLGLRRLDTRLSPARLGAARCCCGHLRTPRQLALAGRHPCLSDGTRTLPLAFNDDCLAALDCVGRDLKTIHRDRRHGPARRFQAVLAMIARLARPQRRMAIHQAPTPASTRLGGHRPCRRTASKRLAVQGDARRRWGGTGEIKAVFAGKSHGATPSSARQARAEGPAVSRGDAPESCSDRRAPSPWRAKRSAPAP